MSNVSILYKIEVVNLTKNANIFQYLCNIK